MNQRYDLSERIKQVGSVKSRMLGEVRVQPAKNTTSLYMESNGLCTIPIMPMWYIYIYYFVFMKFEIKLFKFDE